MDYQSIYDRIIEQNQNTRKGRPAHNKGIPSGKRWYNNPYNKECGLYNENTQPEGWILGRC